MLRAGRRRFYIFFALMLYAADAAVKCFALASGRALSFNEGVSFGLFRECGAEASTADERRRPCRYAFRFRARSAQR